MMPLRHFELALSSIDDGLAEGDGEADGSVADLVVVGVIVHKAAEVVGIELEVACKDCGQAALVIVALRRLDGQAQEVGGIDGLNLNGAGEQDVLKGWRLEDAVIGEVQDRIRGGEITRDGKTRLD